MRFAPLFTCIVSVAACLGCGLLQLPVDEKSSAQTDRVNMSEPPDLTLGTDIKPLVTLDGEHSRITKQKLLRITSAKEWEALWKEHIGSPKSKKRVAGLDTVQLDFSKVMAVAIFDGSAFACTGYKVYAIKELDNQLVMQVQVKSFQTITDSTLDHPSEAWGIVIVPHSNKEIILEQDVNTSLGYPPIWNVWKKFPAIDPPQNLTPEHLDGGIGP